MTKTIALVNEQAFSATVAKLGFNSQPALRVFLEEYLSALPPSSAEARLQELEANEREYERILGKRTYQEVADALGPSAIDMRERAAQCIPTNWLDPLLTGPNAFTVPMGHRSVERLLKALQARVRALPIPAKEGDEDNWLRRRIEIATAELASWSPARREHWQRVANSLNEKLGSHNHKAEE